MRTIGAFAAAAILACAACSGVDSVPSAPSRGSQPVDTGDTQVTPAVSPPQARCPGIGFDDLRQNGAPFAQYSACGFSVSATSASWIVSSTYGHPAPFVQFVAIAGTSVTGEIIVAAGGAKFRFDAVDVYSSTTRIPHVITGSANGSAVFTLQATLGNTFGNFATIRNPYAAVVIDALRIRLTNAAAPCCTNPMGVDNIRVSF